MGSETTNKLTGPNINQGFDDLGDGFGALRFDTKGNALGSPDVFGNKAAMDKREKGIEELAGMETKTIGNTDQSTVTDTNRTQQTTFDPKSAQEQALLDSSVANFNQQQRLVGEQEAGIAGRQGLQQQGRDVLGGIASGEAFGVTGQEQSRIDALRDAELAQGRSGVDSILNERLGQLSADAARRGVRGQAFSQLQTDVVGEAAQSFERQQLEANRLAAQRANEAVGQRTGLQANVGAGLSEFADQARQQAITNRQSLQDPAALKAMREERLASGTTKTTGQDTSRTTGTTTSRTEGQGAMEAARIKAGGIPSAGQQDFANVLGAASAGAEIYGASQGG